MGEDIARLQEDDTRDANPRGRESERTRIREDENPKRTRIRESERTTIREDYNARGRCQRTLPEDVARMWRRVDGTMDGAMGNCKWK
jgi:hypothetical protein